MKTCEIWTLTEQGEELMGNVLLDGTTLSYEFTPGRDDAMADLMQEANVSGDDVTFAASDPVAWFDALPQQYHGTRMWAQMAPETKQLKLKDILDGK